MLNARTREPNGIIGQSSIYIYDDAELKAT